MNWFEKSINYMTKYMATSKSYANINKVHKLLPSLFEQCGWGATLYLINNRYYSTVFEFTPPPYVTDETIYNSSENNFSFVNSPNYNVPVCRLQGNKNGEENSNDNIGSNGSIKMYRQDFIKFLDNTTREGDNILDYSLTILEVIGSLSASPFANTITVYNDVKIVNLYEDVRSQGNIAYTCGINLYFSASPEIYSLGRLLKFSV